MNIENNFSQYYKQLFLSLLSGVLVVLVLYFVIILSDNQLEIYLNKNKIFLIYAVYTLFLSFFIGANGVNKIYPNAKQKILFGYDLVGVFVFIEAFIFVIISNYIYQLIYKNFGHNQFSLILGLIVLISLLTVNFIVMYKLLMNKDTKKYRKYNNKIEQIKQEYLNTKDVQTKIELLDTVYQELKLRDAIDFYREQLENKQNPPELNNALKEKIEMTTKLVSWD